MAGKKKDGKILIGGLTLQQFMRSSIVKYMIRSQYMIDPEFKKIYYDLKMKLFNGKISANSFSKKEKKALLESLARNKKLIQGILK